MTFNVNKRKKIVITTVLLTIGLLSTQLVDFNLRFSFIAGLGIFACILSLWALWEGLTPIKAIILLILPTFFTIAVASAYFLLPLRWLTRIPFVTAYGLFFYLLLLAQNIFNVASIRTIPLHRAALTAGFVATIFTAAVAYDVTRSLNLFFGWNALLVFVISFLLVLQTLWTITMEEGVSFELIIQSFVLSMVLGELALAFSFWPLQHVIWAIMLDTVLYALLGITTYLLQRKLKKSDVAWYVATTGVVFVLGFFITSWTG